MCVSAWRKLYIYIMVYIYSTVSDAILKYLRKTEKQGPYSISLSCSHPISFSLALSLSPSLPLALSLALSVSLSLSPFLSLSLSHTVFPSLFSSPFTVGCICATFHLSKPLKKITLSHSNASFHMLNF